MKGSVVVHGHQMSLRTNFKSLALLALMDQVLGLDLEGKPLLLAVSSFAFQFVRLILVQSQITLIAIKQPNRQMWLKFKRHITRQMLSNDNIFESSP